MARFGLLTSANRVIIFVLSLGKRRNGDRVRRLFWRYHDVEVIMTRFRCWSFRVLVGAGLLLFGAVACAPEPPTSSMPSSATQPQESSTMAMVPTGVPGWGDSSNSLESQTAGPETGRSPLEEISPTDLRYSVDATLNWTTKTLHVRQTVVYLNDTGGEQPSIVLNVEANRQPDLFSLKRVTGTDGQAVGDLSLNESRLEIVLANPLPVNESIEFMLVYDLRIPQIRAGYRFGHLGYWGYSERQANLGMWMPLVAACTADHKWVSPSFHEVGEYFVLRTADFSLDLHIVGAPDNVRVAGPGTVSQPDSRTWHIELNKARELTLSISDQYHLLTTSTESGVDVELYYFVDSALDPLGAAHHALNTATDALALYEELYGAYSPARLVVVEGDFPDGMEFSGLVFVSEDWFRTWTGAENDWLTLITAHEVAHQWWYALVGNDQGQHPYMDEALAIYSELLYLERYYPNYDDWWWNFRVYSYTPTGYVDAPVYEFDTPREYINAVYLRGALMLQAVRTDIGDEAFFAWLNDYANVMRDRVASPADLWRQLSHNAYKQTAPTRAAFFRQIDVFAAPDSIP